MLLTAVSFLNHTITAIYIIIIILYFALYSVIFSILATVFLFFSMFSLSAISFLCYVLLKFSKLILIFIVYSAFGLRFSKYLDPIFIVAFYWLLYISVEGNFMLIDCVYILFFIALSPQISLLGRYSVLKQH